MVYRELIVNGSSAVGRVAEEIDVVAQRAVVCLKNKCAEDVVIIGRYKR